LNLHLSRVAPALISLVAASCSVAPLVQDAGATGPSVLDTVPGSRAIAATASDGVVLRGAVVEAPEAVGVVLHLLPSGASVQAGVPIGVGRTGLASSLLALRDRGFTSVVFDYRGVGASDGGRDTARLFDDGEAMWREAVRLAGGREDRVILRAGSLGSLVAADLVGRVAHPGGVVLFAPVRASTIVRHAIASQRGAVLAWLSGAVYGSPECPDLEDVVSRNPCPMLVVLPREDVYLPAAEARTIEAACRAVRQTVVGFAGDHQATILRSWNFAVDRDGSSGRQVAALCGAESRFLDGLTRWFAGGERPEGPSQEGDCSGGKPSRIAAPHEAACPPSTPPHSIPCEPT